MYVDDYVGLGDEEDLESGADSKSVRGSSSSSVDTWDLQRTTKA